jgi:hypothetical protein
VKVRYGIRDNHILLRVSADRQRWLLLFYRATMIQRIASVITQRKQAKSLVATLQEPAPRSASW